MTRRSSLAALPRLAGKKSPRAYHHGGLREAMLAAAGQLIEEQGIDRLTLRECARRAGVSHGAPAHHFRDVRGLLTELAAEGFDALVVEMDRHEAAAPKDAYAQFIANGQAYVAYALTHRGRFQLMFRSDWVDWDAQRLQIAGRAAYGRLQQHIDAVLRASGAGPALQEAKTAFAWVIVHGLSTLALEGQLCSPGSPSAAGGAKELLDQLLALARPGIEAVPGSDPAIDPPGRV